MSIIVNKQRNSNIDIIKGLLILLVIAGHIIPGSLTNTFSRYIIYAFHMPLFIGISGYLSNTEKFKESSLFSSLKRFFPRVIIPWAIASLFFFFLKKGVFLNNDLSSNIDMIALSILKPWYHLWFIPAFISYNLLLQALLKLKINSLLIIIFALIITIVLTTVNMESNNTFLTKSYDIFDYTFRFENFLFFAIGNAIRNLKTYKPSTLQKDLLSVFLLIGILSLVLNFYTREISLKLFSLLSINIPAILVTINYFQNTRKNHSKILEFIGVNSLGFYLWHMVFVTLFKDLFKDSTLLLYIFNTFGFFFLFFAIKGLSRSKILGKYFLGT